MAKNRQIKATLVLSEGNFFTNIKKASSGLRDLKKNFDNNSSSMKKHASVLDSTGKGLTSLAKKAVGVAAAYVSIKKVTSVAQECMEKAKNAEQANVRLNTIMQQIPGITQEAKDGVAAYCKELSKQTSIGGTAQKMGASQLASFKMSAESVKKLMPSLNNLAVAQYGVSVSGDQMIQAANMLGKAYSGQTGALTRAGVVLSDTQAKIIKNGTDAQKTAALVEVLTQNFGNLAGEMANTKEGQLVRIKNSIGGIKTMVGNKLLPVVAEVTGFIADKLPIVQSAIEKITDKISPYIQSAINGIKFVFDKISPMVKDTISTKIIPAVSAVWKFISGVFSSIKDAFTKNEKNFSKTGELINSVGNVFKSAWNAIQPILNFIKDFIIPEIVAVIGDMIPVLTKVFDFVAKMVTFTGKQCKIVWGIIIPYVTMLWKNIRAGLNLAVTFVVGAFKSAWEAIKFCWSSVGNFFKAVWETIKGIFSVVKAVLTGDWQGASDAVKGIIGTWGGFFSGVWEGIKNVFATTVNWFGDTFSAAWEAIKSVFSNTVGFFQGIWDTIKNMFTSIGISIADGISGAFKSVINAVIKFAGGLINNFIRGINWAIDKINAIPGVSISKLTEISLPMLAKGGIIRRGGDVIVGERGPEMLSLPRGAQVTPLPAGATSGGNTYTNTFYVTVNADDGSAAARFVRQVKEILDNM